MGRGFRFLLVYIVGEDIPFFLVENAILVINNLLYSTSNLTLVLLLHSSRLVRTAGCE